MVLFKKKHEINTEMDIKIPNNLYPLYFQGHSTVSGQQLIAALVNYIF